MTCEDEREKEKPGTITGRVIATIYNYTIEKEGSKLQRNYIGGIEEPSILPNDRFRLKLLCYYRCLPLRATAIEAAMAPEVTKMPIISHQNIGASTPFLY